MLDTVFPTVEAIGIIAFGVSGYLVARRRCLDVYGTVVLALVTALGGGAIRDLILEEFPAPAPAPRSKRVVLQPYHLPISSC